MMRPYVPVTPSPKKSLHSKPQLCSIDKNSAICISESDEEDKEITNNVSKPTSTNNVSTPAVRTSRFFSKVSTPVIDLVSPDLALGTTGNSESNCQKQVQSSEDDTPVPVFKRSRRSRRTIIDSDSESDSSNNNQSPVAAQWIKRKSEPLRGNNTTTSTKVAKSATNSTSLSRFAFGGGKRKNKRKLVDLAESSDDEERVDVDWENVEADRLQEDLMGEFDSGESDDSSMSEDDEEEMDEEAQRRERERCLLEACRKVSTKLKRGRSESRKRDALAALKTQLIDLFPDRLSLTNHQIEGLSWLMLLHRLELSGILADEMGLGKTVQVVALMAMLLQRCDESCSFLIVVPTSLIEQWKREIHKWAPDLQLIVYHGPARDREDIRAQVSHHTFSGAMITTYTLFERSSSSSDRNFLKLFKFDYVVLDEGHCMKNPNSSRYQRLAKLKFKRRLLLTGTPIQNDLGELFAILMFIMPSIFSKTDKDDFKADVARVRELLSPFVLRRVKQDIMQALPPKVEKTIRVKMLQAPSQKLVYNSLVNKLQAQRRVKIAGENAASAKDLVNAKEFEHIATTCSIFTELRKTANHPLLVRNRFAPPAVFQKVCQHLHSFGWFGDDCTLEMVVKEMKTYSDFHIHEILCDCPGSKLLDSSLIAPLDLKSSAKAQYLLEFLPQLHKEGHRVLLFSQWTSMMDILQEFISSTLQLSMLRMDGQTGAKERQELVDRYNSDPDIFLFLLSTKAGGVGLNLTSADTVILHDIDFNPQNDRQAMDRCHRMGQTKLVSVYRLVTAETVDQRISEISQRKEELDKLLLTKNKSLNNGFLAPTDTDDVRGMKEAILNELCE